MIDQHQFQQAAKHYRSGRISLGEFQTLVSDGIETKAGKTEPNPKRGDDTIITQGDKTEILVNLLGQLKSDGQPALVTGVSDDLGALLTQQIADGEFDSDANTFACDNGAANNSSNDNLAVIAIVDDNANFKTGYLAAIVASK